MNKGKIREELFPPSLVPRPSGIGRTTKKARGPAEEYEVENEEEFRVGKWDYLGGRSTERRKEERKNTRIETEGNKWSRYEPQRHTIERKERERREDWRAQEDKPNEETVSVRMDCGKGVGEEARVDRPSRRAEVKISGLDEGHHRGGCSHGDDQIWGM